MTECKSLDKQFLSEFLSNVETKAHHLYALMAGLPKEHFYLFRYYDNARNTDCWPDDKENIFSLREFLDRIDTFHPEDDFGIYFSVHLDRIDSIRAEEYTDSVSIDDPEEATISTLAENAGMFLESYCEKCLRDNRPFELTPEVIARFGFTPEDVAALKPGLDRHNAAARRMIQAEYDALRKLDFIRKAQ